jgi:hypothetical protein
MPDNIAYPPVGQTRSGSYRSGPEPSRARVEDGRRAGMGRTVRPRVVAVVLAMSVLSLVVPTSASARADSSPSNVEVTQRAAVAQPDTDFAGMRIRMPRSTRIYLVDPEGFRRWIPDQATYTNLFRNGADVTEWDVRLIAERDQISSGAVLVRAEGSVPVYVVSNGQKRWITSPEVMDKYGFEWSQIREVPPVVVDTLPTGPAWS